MAVATERRVRSAVTPTLISRRPLISVVELNHSAKEFVGEFNSRGLQRLFALRLLMPRDVSFVC